MKFLILLATAFIAVSAVCKEKYAYSNLMNTITQEQKDEYTEVFEQMKDDRNKFNFKQELYNIFSTYRGDLIDVVDADKALRKKRIADTAQKVKTLSSEAQQVYQEMEKFRLNNNISITDTLKGRKEALAKASPAVLKELQKADLYGVKDERDYIYDV